MLKRFSVAVVLICLMVSMCGCVALLAGAAGGAGTAYWLQGKLVQALDASLERSLKATKYALGAMKFEVTKETKKEDVVQVISKYSDGRTVWIDIRPLTETTSRIEIRVGATGDKEAASRILNKIKRYL